MFSFQKPKYLNKRVHPVTKKPEPSYQFDMDYKSDILDSPLSWLVRDKESLSVSALEQELKENQVWWNEVVSEFLKANASYFSKPYTAQQIQKIIRHRLELNSGSLEYPCCVSCIPFRMELVGSVMFIDWKYKTFPVGIHIPDEDQDNTEFPVEVNGKLIQTNEDIEEWDPDEVPMDGDEKEEYDVKNGAKLLDKQRVREARLKAKLAVYRAQQQMNKFYDKYGDEVSDSDSNATTDVDSEEEEDEDEELQM
jgi:hypothetical protein